MLCFVVVMQSFIMNSHEVFIHIHQGCFAGTGAIVRLPQCQWSKPDGYGKISQCITTTKHRKAKTVCIFLGIYCNTCTPNTEMYIQYKTLHVITYPCSNLTNTKKSSLSPQRAWYSRDFLHTKNICAFYSVNTFRKCTNRVMEMVSLSKFYVY